MLTVPSNSPIYDKDNNFDVSKNKSISTANNDGNLTEKATVVTAAGV